MKELKLFVRGYRGVGKGSKFITWWTGGSISHVSLVFHMNSEPQELEAIQGQGVIAHPPHSELNFVELTVPLTQEQIIDAHILAMSFIGARYDWQGIWSFLLRRTKHSKDQFFCSELVSYVLLKVGYKLSRRLPYKETPASVCESLRLLDVA